MTTKFEEIVLEEIFKLSGKFDKVQDEMKDLKKEMQYMNGKMDQKFAEQDKKIDQKFAEQDKKINQKFAEQDKKIDQKFEEQAREIAEMFTDTFHLTSKYLRETEQRITKETDKKIENLRIEFIRQKV